MPQYLSDEDVGLASGRTAGERAFRSDPLVRQAQAAEPTNLATAKRIQEEELKPGGGSLLPNTLTRNPNAPQGKRVILSDADVGLESPAPATSGSDLFSSFGEPLSPPPAAPETDGPYPLHAEATFAGTPGGAATGIAGRNAKRRPGASATELVSKGLGAAAQVSDMLTSTGKALLGQAVYWGANTAVLAKTGEPKTAATAAQMAKDSFFPPELSTPWAKVAERLGPAAQKAYNENPVAWVMGKMGTFIEHGGKAAGEATGLPPEHFSALAEQFMGSLGWKAMKPPLVRAFRERMRQEPSGPEPRVEPTMGEPPPGPKPTPAPRALESGATYEGEFSRVQEDSAVPPEARSPEQNQRLLNFNAKWAKDNALPLGVAAALGAYTLKGDDPEKGIIGLGLLGAMKPKGGMWHWKAAETVADPLISNMLRRSGFTTRDLQLPDEELVAPSAYENPIGQQLIADIAADRNDIAWAKKAAQTYLNKHMGTETDPLKDIEIPFDEGTKKWSEVTDALVHSRPLRDSGGGLSSISPGLIRSGKVSLEEPVWNIKTATWGLKEANAFKSYLSHVGDYLRQNVDPAKLSQYDLVRAVRETAQNDAKVAKAMEKEAAESGKDLPVHKEYPDGFKWVELKLPEKLTEEQARRVANIGELANAGKLDEYAHRRDFEPTHYIALGSDGKPIYNTYTGDPAFGSTPERAHLAGQLAREGNQMGHCVGGYCEGVASGASRIYSLRDAKGKSHVTVEVTPAESSSANIRKFMEEGPGADPVFQEEHPYPGRDPEQPFRSQRLIQDWESAVENSPEFRAWLAEQPPRILQIKGKQNRAPNKEYLPYVQDFVKSGKWGEVEDLENTGLVRRDNLSPDAYAALRKATGDKAYYGPEDVQKAIQESFNELPEEGKQLGVVQETLEHAKEPDSARNIDALLRRLARGRQEGSIDPKLLARLAALGLGAAAGAALDPENPFHGALLGLLAGAAVTRMTPANAMKIYRKVTQPGRMVRIDQLSRATQHAKLQIARAAWQVENRIMDLVPSLKRREALTRVFETGNLASLSGKERVAAQELRTEFNKVATSGLAHSSLEDMVNIYISHLYGEKGKEWLRTRVGAPLTKIPTIADMRAQGLRPVTEDAAAIYGIYANAVGRALENKAYIAVVKSATVGPANTPVAVPIGRGGYQDYVTIKHPQMTGLKVHPDIAPELEFVFDQNDPNVIMRGLDALSTTQKRLAVAFSLFHAKSLLDAAVGASKVLKTPVRTAKAIGQSIAPSVFGRNIYLDQLRKGGAGDLVDDALKDGLKFSFERQAPAVEEQGAGFYPVLKALEQFLDDTVPGAGKPIKGLEWLNHKFDSFMWGRLHAGLKLELYAEKVSELLKNNPNLSRDEAGTMAASFANDVFGGLDWLRLAQGAQTRLTRSIASAAVSPSGRQVMRLAIFAPDWTISTTRAFVKAFGKGSNLPGLLRPKALADLHRQYILRSAAFYFVIADSLNMYFSGHHIWDNKDWTRVDLGDGRTMQLSKHFMEPIHWILHPGQQGLNKLGLVPKEVLNQALHTEYLSAYGRGSPPMKGSRLGHLARQFVPITGQQASDPTAAVAGFLGAPIYGKKDQ